MSGVAPQADTGEVGLKVNEHPVRLFEVRWQSEDGEEG